MHDSKSETTNAGFYLVLGDWKLKLTRSRECRIFKECGMNKQKMYCHRNHSE